jgi:hypothetical protein
MQVIPREPTLTDYERAVCYYTLPKVISPVTIGLLFAYALCVLEAAAALGYGISTDNRFWTFAGFYSFIGIIVFGMVAFTIRAGMNDWRKRVALAMAHNAPNAVREDDVPDPFEKHVLLSRPARLKGDVFACVNREGDISHCVEIKRYNGHWRVSDAENKILFDVRAMHGARQLRVYAGKAHLASIDQNTTLRGSTAQVFTLEPSPKQYTVVNGCIYESNRLVGRIYRLRDAIYLDVEEAFCTGGLLAYFISLK